MNTNHKICRNPQILNESCYDCYIDCAFYYECFLKDNPENQKRLQKVLILAAK